MTVSAATLLAIDPSGLGGMVVRGAAGPVRDAWSHDFEAMHSPAVPRRRIPVGITVDRLNGGLDLAATLAAGSPIMAAGLLRETRGGFLLLPMAERSRPHVVSALLGYLDGSEGRSEGALLAFDESTAEEPGVAAALQERLAFRIDLEAALTDAGEVPDSLALDAARARFAAVSIGDQELLLLSEAAAAFGVDSARATIFAMRAARAAAALAGRAMVNEADITLATCLVIAPRATRLPAAPEQDVPPEPPPPSADAESESTETQQSGPVADRILEAARAFVAPGLLAGTASRSHARLVGRGGGEAKGSAHGRRVGAMAGDPRRGARLDLVETLRAAAPWQRLRPRRDARLAIRRDDFRVQRLVHRTGKTVIFVVDASGSAAIHRLSEAKGAVELLLAESYVHRDRVALISFRGTRAELMLPPTRSLARARRALAGLPGGGGTPLADALLTASRVAAQVRREADGSESLLVLLTDARANVALDGTGGRPRAEADALQAAAAIAQAGVAAVLIDTGARPSPFAAQLAARMSATYYPLPVADAHSVSAVIRRVGAA